VSCDVDISQSADSMVM